MKKFILAAALAAVAFPAFAEAPRANVDPAIWVVKDKDTTVYLFGTVHALDGKQDWFNDEVKKAYDSSQELVVEALMPADPAQFQAKVLSLAMDKSGKPLSAKLKPENARLLAAELGKMGAPANAFDQFEPWFASLQMAAIVMQKLGMKPETGVESILKDAAKKDGKSVGELETFEWQLRLFDSLPEDLQIAMLNDSIEGMADAETEMAKLLKTWSTGDIDNLAKLMNDAMLEYPALGKVLLADRNSRWAEWIDKRLDKPGTVFMAVGAGHLGGPDSVQAMLAKRGIKSKRLNKRVIK
jgi:uncharacterized protein YbaP (TraB family)